MSRQFGCKLLVVVSTPARGCARINALDGNAVFGHKFVAENLRASIAQARGNQIGQMSKQTTIRYRLSAVAMGVAGLVVLAGIAYAILGARSDATAGDATTAGEITGSTSPLPERSLGKSGLPLPRFVSLKTDRVNVRRGPSSQHDVSWVFTRKELPVEIIAEFEHWRRVRDSDGEEGWIYQSLLAGRRTVMVAPWRKNNNVPLLDEPSATSGKVALVAGGVVGRVRSCDGQWCRVTVSDYDGYIEQAMLWGVYPGERVKP